MIGYALAVGLGLAQLAIGLLAGAWWMRRRMLRRGAANATWVPQLLERCRQLTSNMADDVGEFRTGLTESCSRLNAIQTNAAHRSPKQLADAVVGVVNDVVELNARLQERLAATEQKLHDQSEQLASYLSEARTDGLTGLPNRRAFDDELHRQFARWQRRRHPLSILLIDVDQFKRFNDQHGHRAGDHVLRGVGGVLLQAMRDCDLVARFGGEEFAVVLPDTDGGQAKIAAERARLAIHSAAFPYENANLAVSVSVGAAEVNSYDDSQSFVERADQALYTSKRSGRNCGHFHNGQWCEPISDAPAAVVASAKAVAASATLTAAGANVPSGPIAALTGATTPELATASQVIRARLAEVTTEANPTRA